MPHIHILAPLSTMNHVTVYITSITKAENTILGGQCVKSHILLPRGPNAGTLVTYPILEKPISVFLFDVYFAPQP